MALLEVKKAGFSYPTRENVFTDISFTLEKVEIFTILGPNGAGKSTLLNSLANLTPLTTGEILVDGARLDKMSSRETAFKIAYVPQTTEITYGYSVRDYIAMGRAAHVGMLVTPKKKDYEIVDETISLLGIEHLAHRLCTQISGGEKQQACIARAIVQQPEIILFDEPTSALDYGNQLNIMRLIKKLCGRDYAVIMTTHNPDQPILLEGKAGILDRDGHMLTGTVSDILSEKTLSAVYRTALHLVYVEEAERMACIAAKI